MKKQVQGILYYLSSDIRYSMSIFWSILGALLLFTIILDLFIGGEHSTVQFNLSFPIYVFAGIAGYLAVKSVIPYLVKFGATRKHMFISIIIYFFGLSVVNALIANILHSTTASIIGSNNTAGITFYDGDSSYNLHHLADILEVNNWFTRIIVDTSISFFLFIVFFIIGLIFFRYGLIGGFSFVGLMIFTLIYGLTNGWLIDFFITVFSDFSIVFFYQLLFVGLVIYLLTYFLIKRLTI